MNVTVHGDSAVPPFEQVRAQLAQQINDGTLAVGTKLPTVRALAAELGIAANTAARAYRELESAGMIDTRGRSGTFVSSSGDRSRLQAAEHAAEYARAVDGLGIDREEALAIVRAALDV
ncbi:transcriptional regulator, GntR family [Haloechinothrix alba]|uniref:Transcriptional regulator, GntR family n=1 Tax=Haloechinothrix alba TaxID=664784 RepID=A0A238W3P1_9PSEU|nr:GntR family transcriptional regulator [Haloechinothrix alba]SNR41160.1 transcriptional regulator, GntR family [Haloechinothrix alba]